MGANLDSFELTATTGAALCHAVEARRRFPASVILAAPLSLGSMVGVVARSRLFVTAGSTKVIIALVVAHAFLIKEVDGLLGRVSVQGVLEGDAICIVRVDLDAIPTRRKVIELDSGGRPSVTLCPNFFEHIPVLNHCVSLGDSN